nr:TetR/AcrR family transcriptional regulator C-terminal ligand-binding domain-containing protein [Streptomyces sp. 840.1]
MEPRARSRTGPTRARLSQQRAARTQRAVRRGAVNPALLEPRLVSLPFDLFRHEVLPTLRPVTAETIERIVDWAPGRICGPAENSAEPSRRVGQCLVVGRFAAGRGRLGTSGGTSGIRNCQDRWRSVRPAGA